MKNINTSESVRTVYPLNINPVNITLAVIAVFVF